ncbi:MAG: D-alanine--D-alanine ligase [Chloroflexota bacterium]
MRVGLAYDLKEDILLSGSHPEDALEEYDSRTTVEAISEVLESLGNSVVMLGGGRKFLTNVLEKPVDFVFNIAEGRGDYRSREAQIPAVLEMLGIPYSGSDPQCLSICLDKPLTKNLVSMAGIRTPMWQVINSSQDIAEIANDFPAPAFIKPAYEGSSKGIRLGSKLETPEQITQAATDLLEHYRQPVMIEEFIAGEEVTVGVVGNSPTEIIGLMRILPRDKRPDFIYSLEVKRDWEQLVNYECPARLEAGIVEEIKEFSLRTFKALGCRDFARMDFRIDRTGRPFFLEINPLPGLNPKSGDLVILAGKMGWSYEALLSAIFNAALARYPECVRK